MYYNKSCVDVVSSLLKYLTVLYSPSHFFLLHNFTDRVVLTVDL